MQNNRLVGYEYEQIAKTYLENKGYQILKQNYRTKVGEIDLIALDKDVLVFVEVKYRSDLKKGHPLEAVGKKKQQIICKCASYYMMVEGCIDRDARFDVIGIIGNAGKVADQRHIEDLPIEVLHVKNAFEYC